MSNVPKNVQIPLRLFRDVCDYCLSEERSPELVERLRKGLYDKLDRIAEHLLYANYAQAATPEERKAALDKYLDECRKNRSE